MEHLRFGWRNWRIPRGLQKVLRVVLFTLERKGEVEKKFGGFWGREMSFWRNRGSLVLTKLTSRMMCSIRRATCNMSQNSSRYWTNGRFLGFDQYRDSKAEHVWDCNHLLKYSPQSLCYVLHKPIPQLNETKKIHLFQPNQHIWWFSWNISKPVTGKLTIISRIYMIYMIYIPHKWH